MTTRVSEPEAFATGFGSVQLPPGMTQEEADRLVREADERTRNKETQS